MVLYVDQFYSLINKVVNNNVDDVKTIIKSNPFLINEKNNRGWTPLIISVYNGLNDMTDLLLECGADPGVTNPKGTSPLMYAKECALRDGNMHGLETLLSFGIEKQHQDIFQRTIYDYLNRDSKFFEDVLNLLS